MQLEKKNGHKQLDQILTIVLMKGGWIGLMSSILEKNKINEREKMSVSNYIGISTPKKNKGVYPPYIVRLSRLLQIFVGAFDHELLCINALVS